MKYPCVLLFIIFLSLKGYTQKNFFLYIQTEDKKPFSVRMNNAVYSSTEMGYVVIPKLFDGQYELKIDFSKNELQQQQFDLNIHHQDLGFLLKNTDSKGWVLQNLQSGLLIESKTKPADQVKDLSDKKDDFSVILSQVSNTPVVTEVILPVDNLAKEEKSGLSSDSVQSTAADSALYNQVISKIFTSADSVGYSLIYAVSLQESTDTVVLFIPADSVKSISLLDYTPADTLLNQTINLSENQELQKNTTENNLVSVADSSFDNSVGIKQIEKTEADSLNVKPNMGQGVLKCKKMAENKDFLQLRKKMASQDNETQMLLQVEKAFQSKCFSSQQVRNLSGLFLEDGNKLDFLIMSRNKLSDPENFGSMISLLSEEPNIIKFKELIQ